SLGGHLLLALPLLLCAASAAGRAGLPRATGPSSSASLVELGRTLFNDTRLSADGTVGCIGCHVPERAFTDGRQVAIGTNGRVGTRNTPTLLNVAFARAMFWDGRKASLEEQIPEPFLNPLEHGLADESALLLRVHGDERYQNLFGRGFGAEAQISMREVVVAI